MIKRVVYTVLFGNSLIKRLAKARPFSSIIKVINSHTNGLVIRRLATIQQNAITKNLDAQKKTIAFYYASAAYREQVGDIAEKLKKKGYNVIQLFGNLYGDSREHEEGAYFSGGEMIQYFTFIDLIICVTLTKHLPPHSKRLLFVHDIHDSPLGNIKEFQTLSLNYQYFFLPSNIVIQRIAKQVSSANTMYGGHVEQHEKKCLIPGGYIKLDGNIRYFLGHKEDTKTLIFATTMIGVGFEDVVCLDSYATEIIDALLNSIADYTLIFRPHPHTIDTKYVVDIRKRFEHNPHFVLDDNASFYMANYSKAALMITDMSGTAYTYAFTTQRPVVFFSHNEAEVEKRFGDYQYFHDREKVGYVARNVDEMVEKVRLLLTERDWFAERIREYRDSLIFNIGRSEQYFVDNIDYILEDKTHPDWEYV